MTRLEANSELLEKIPKNYSGKRSEDVIAKIELSKLALLEDISVSLAFIADKLGGNDDQLHN